MNLARSFNRPALLASLLVTGVAVALESTGALARLEGMTLTQRFAYARSTPQPLNDRIALVAIDDGSERAIGRWPWNRSQQALGIDEIARAGASVVAFDVMYFEPSSDPAEDQALAEAIARARSIVAANVVPDDIVGEIWMDPLGRAQLDRLLEVLGASIEMPRDLVVERAGLVEPWRSRFLSQPLAFRELAAWTRLQRLRDQGRRPASFEQFLMLLGVPRALVQGQSPERQMLQRLWERDLAWQALAGFMPPATGRPSPRESPPLRAIAEAASGVGMVHGPADPGGQTRRVLPAVPTPAGDCLQLGLAAAAEFKGVPARQVRIETDRVVVGDVVLPLTNGTILVDWPTATFDGWPSLRGGGPQRVAVPFGTLVSLGRQRQVQARNETNYREAAEILAEFLSRDAEPLRSPPLDPSVLHDLRDAIEFSFPGLLEQGLEALPEDATEEEIEPAKRCLEWWTLHEAVLAGREVIADAESRLREALSGTLVFIGHVATGAMADMINTPFGARTPGVFVHAAVASMVLDHRSLRVAPAWTAPLATVTLGLLCALVAAGMGAGRGSAVALVLLLAAFAAVWFAFGLWSIVLPMVAPLSAGFASWVAGVTMVAVISQRERARVMRQFRARVSPQLVERLAANPDAVSVGGVEREVTILFGDLAGFTTLSEQLEGAEVVRTLNRYMSALTRELTARGAYVNKFLGDGLLAFWSAFGEEPRQRRLAVEAALQCQRAVAALGQDPEFRGRPPIRLRLGIATGEVVVGDCGAPPELNDYTVIGDAVNLSSRLESANKQFGTPILMDGTTAAGVIGTPGAPVLLRLGRVVVVGQSVPVELFTVLDGTMSEAMRAALESAVEAFESGDRAKATQAWRDFAAKFDRSSLAKPFLQALEDAEEPMDGILRLRAK